jgi:hypothetical protein
MKKFSNVNVQLTEEQCQFIEEATGVRVSELTLFSHGGEDDMLSEPQLESVIGGKPQLNVVLSW